MAESGMLIRKLVADDMPQAARLHRASFDERLPWLAGLHTAEEDSGYWSSYLFPTCDILGAEGRGILLGVIAFRESWIDQLYVLPNAQGKGIGSALIEIAKAVYPELHLWTFQRNIEARRFYEARGFVAICETDGAGNEEREPDPLAACRRINPLAKRKNRWLARLHPRRGSPCRLNTGLLSLPLRPSCSPFRGRRSCSSFPMR